MQWEVIEVQGSNSLRKFKGTEEEAKNQFDLMTRMGASNKLILRDDKGEVADEFLPAAPEGGGLTGKPVKEVSAPLPPALLGEAAKLREQQERAQMEAIRRSTEKRPELHPSARKPARARKAIASALRWALERVS